VQMSRAPSACHSRWYAISLRYACTRSSPVAFIQTSSKTPLTSIRQGKSTVVATLGLLGLVGSVRVEHVAQPVAEAVQREDRQEQRTAGENHEMRRRLQVLKAIDEETPPTRRRWLCAKTDEAEERLGKDRLGDCERDLNDHEARRVRKHVHPQHS